MRQIDAVDARILLTLSDDPRLSGVEIAQRLGLSRNTVQSRLARLEAGDVLSSVERRVLLRALGYSMTAFINARVDQHRLDEIERALTGIPEVVEVHGLAGPQDLLIRVVAVDADDLYRLAGAVLAIPGMERTEVAMSVREMVGMRATPLLRARLRGEGA